MARYLNASKLPPPPAPVPEGRPTTIANSLSKIDLETCYRKGSIDRLQQTAIQDKRNGITRFPSSLVVFANQQNPNPILDFNDGDSPLMACESSLLVDWLSQENTDMALLDSFLLCYRSLMTPEQLFQRLRDKWDNISQLERHSSEAEDVIRDLHGRVIYILRKWIDRYYHTDFQPRNNLLNDLSEWIITLEGNTQFKQYSRSLHRLLELLATPHRTLSQPEMEESEGPSQLDFLATSIVDMANQMTLLEEKLFHESDLVDLLRLTENEGNKADIPLVRHFNIVSGWVSTEIVTQPNLRKRAYVLKRFILLAEKLLEMQNFNSFLEIISGLNNVAVSRLKRTWKASKMDKRFEELERIMETRRNYGRYRQCLVDATGPVLPYFGVFLRDLSVAQMGNSSMVNNDEGRPLVNVERFRILHKIAQELEQTRRLSYQIQPVPSILCSLHNLSYLSDDSLYQHSLLCEPSNEF